ncbi:MAG TPA: hypothetical protein PLI19_02545 [Erysipelotrichaceae bacterium]|nr:hypothetical protein [Erysipelotrichaceae bacterium]HQB32190.1 hypothetical protein [Erysipelotrichaceae bacterium]
MREPFYMVNDTVILNFSSEYHQSLEQLVSSEGFKMFLARYLKDLAIRDIITFKWLTKSRKLEEMVAEIVVLAKQLLVLEIDEIYNPLVEFLNRTKTLFVLEDAYNYWRSKQRFSVVNASNENRYFNSFIEADSKFNQLVLQLYRILKEKLQGKTNIVYHQLQAGTGGGCIIKHYKWQPPAGYNFLKNIVFLNMVILKTPFFLHSKNVEGSDTFVKLDNSPIKNAGINQLEWLCFPAKVGDLLCHCYFHKDFLASGLLLANLFEMADEEECTKRKPDIICLYGCQSDSSVFSYYYDEPNDIIIGSLSYSYKIDCPDYLRGTILTLHNMAKSNKNQLPVQGSMIRVCFSDGAVRAIVLVGDEKSGKTEIIDTIKKMSRQDNSEKRIIRADIIFSTAGCFKIVDNQVIANGSEIGSIIKINQQDKTVPLKDMERSIFLNPGTGDARAILPMTSYSLISAPNRIDMILYVNSSSEKPGLEKFNDLKTSKEVFFQPKGDKKARKSQEKTFATVFGYLFAEEVYVGQININKNDGCKDGIIEASKQLLEKMKEI